MEIKTLIECSIFPQFLGRGGGGELKCRGELNLRIIFVEGGVVIPDYN